MEPTTASARSSGTSIEGIIATAKAVVGDPRTFYRTMPRSGGFVEPLIFVVAMNLAASILAIPFWIAGVGPYVGSPGLIVAVVLPVVMSTIGSFIGGALLFFVWRLLGSSQSYETAYRCCAYTSVLAPIASLANVVPYLGSLVLLAWAMFLLIIASEEVHGVESQRARMVFGVIGVVLALMTIGSQRTAHRVHEATEALNKEIDGIEEMTPEEAGKAVGEFMKGLQGAVGDKPADTDDPPE